jgi:hypothetical protein
MTFIRAYQRDVLRMRHVSNVPIVCDHGVNLNTIEWTLDTRCCDKLHVTTLPCHPIRMSFHQWWKHRYCLLKQPVY